MESRLFGLAKASQTTPTRSGHASSVIRGCRRSVRQTKILELRWIARPRNVEICWPACYETACLVLHACRRTREESTLSGATAPISLYRAMVRVQFSARCSCHIPRLNAGQCTLAGTSRKNTTALANCRRSEMQCKIQASCTLRRRGRCKTHVRKRIEVTQPICSRTLRPFSVYLVA